MNQNNFSVWLRHIKESADICSSIAGMSKASLVTDSLLQYNGNDAIALVRSGVTIDMAGQANAGADVMWGVDLTLQRKNYVTHPSSIFNPAEWSTLPIDSYSMLGSHQMAFTLAEPFYVLQNALVGLNTSYPIQNLIPNGTYIYSVESMRSGVIAPAINTMQLHTAALDIPEISDATNVESNQFTANWGASPYASGYLLNVYKVSGQADTTEVEGFASVGANGTPLPAGWTGNASATYPTATSSGIAIPSINLKLNEWLQTKTYPHPVSKFTYMYRIASTSTGSSLVIDGLSNNIWVRLDSLPYKNTTKTYPVYSFTKEQGMTAFRFKYNKIGSGNLAIDDVSATYGNQDTVYVQKNVPVIANSILISGLTDNTQYNYAVRATLGSSVSGVSETIGVRTLVKTKLADQSNPSIRIFFGMEHLTVSGLKGDETIRIYSLTGACLYQIKASSGSLVIPFGNRGIYLVKIQNAAYQVTGKFVH